MSKRGQPRTAKEIAADTMRTGRPPTENPCSQRITIRMTPGELAALEAWATERGLAPSTAIREIVVRATRRGRA